MKLIPRINIVKFVACTLLASSVPAGTLFAGALEKYPAPTVGERLTPSISKSPRINGADVFAIKPGADFVFRIPVSGARPMSIKAMGLPSGVKCDPAKGIISGKISRQGEFYISVTAKNSRGTATKKIKIRSGGPLLATPPMGWNSWYSYSEAVSQEGIEKMLKNMDESGLADHGWSFVNIDDCWQGVRGGKYNAIQPNVRFPSMKKLCDYAHSLGLKLGIYSTPWMGTYAGFIGGSSPTENGDYSSKYIPTEKRGQETQFFGTYPGTLRQGMGKVGPYWFFDRDAKQFSDWGIDYIKVDWQPNDEANTKRMFDDLSKAKRAIVLSLSNAAPYKNMDGLVKYANVTRTTGDIHDSWGSIKNIGFSQEKWQKYLKPGHYPDPDMLQVGKIGQAGRRNTSFRPTRLTPDEQFTQVSLWALLSAPFLMSCDMGDLDDFTKGLLMNDEVIAVQQDAEANPAAQVYNADGFQIWTKKLSNGDISVGFFNLNDTKSILKIETSKFSAGTHKKVRDLWRQKNAGTLGKTISVELNPHGVTLFRLSE